MIDLEFKPEDFHLPIGNTAGHKTWITTDEASKKANEKFNHWINDKGETLSIYDDELHGKMYASNLRPGVYKCIRVGDT